MKSENVFNSLNLHIRNKEEAIFFSVIIPTYNRGDRIEVCLDSLLNQSYKFFEVIVCDDGSIDNTREIVELYNDRLNLRYVWEENWGGPARPRNNGIRIAKGKWICFLDSDDWWYSNKLEIVYHYILNNPDINVISHDLMLNDIILGKTYLLPCGPVVPNLYRDLLVHGNRFLNSALCVKKSTLDLNNITIQGIKEIISVEDYDLCMQLAACNAVFACINIPLGEYMVENDNISTNKFHEENLEFLLRKHVFEIQTFEVDKKKLWLKVYSRLNFIKGISRFRIHSYVVSGKYFIRSFKSSQINFMKYVLSRASLSLKRIRTYSYNESGPKRL